MQLRLERQFSPFLNAAQRILLGRLVKDYESYHPVSLGTRCLSHGERSCTDRWNLVASYLRDLGPSSLIDLGCAEGFFVQQAAKTLDCFALGIDADLRRLTTAHMSATLNAVPQAGFMYGNIDEALLRRLPQFDVVVFLSVMHHLMYEHGIGYARKIAMAIRRVTRQCLVFDMGQSNETQHAWSTLLPDMSPSPEVWITEFLHSAGFSSVEVVGDTDAYKSEARRYLFIARP